MGPNADNIAFFTRLKESTQRQGCQWLPGLGEDQIAAFEQALGFTFPAIYRDYLRCMIGTSSHSITLYSSATGKPVEQRPDANYYSYPRDLVEIKDLISWIYDSNNIDEAYVSTHHVPHIVPIIHYHFLIIDNGPGNPVYSMYGNDVIADFLDLKSFLASEVEYMGSEKHLAQARQAAEIAVPFWSAL